VLRIGIDLGGTKIEVAAFGGDGREILRRRVATPHGDYALTVSAIVELVRGAERETGAPGTVGIGIPGALSTRTGLVKNANSTALIGHSLKQDIERALGREVRIANDANCFALSEATDGAAAGASIVFGVILGTGVGGGIVVNGRVLVGANAISGEWGHNPLPRISENDRPLPRCYCGREACIEAYLSGPALERDHGKGMEARAIVAGAEAGDVSCVAALARHEERLARALAGVINLLDPVVIVLGGGLSNIERLYQNVPRLWGPHVFSDTIDTRLVRNHYGDSSGVRGAAWLWDLDKGAMNGGA